MNGPFPFEEWQGFSQFFCQWQSHTNICKFCNSWITQDARGSISEALSWEAVRKLKHSSMIHSEQRCKIKVLTIKNLSATEFRIWTQVRLSINCFPCHNLDFATKEKPSGAQLALECVKASVNPLQVRIRTMTNKNCPSW